MFRKFQGISAKIGNKICKSSYCFPLYENIREIPIKYHHKISYKMLQNGSFNEHLLKNEFYEQIICEIAKKVGRICRNLEVGRVQKCANLVDLVKSCLTSILQTSASIQPRMDLPKFAKH